MKRSLVDTSPNRKPTTTADALTPSRRSPPRKMIATQSNVAEPSSDADEINYDGDTLLDALEDMKLCSDLIATGTIDPSNMSLPPVSSAQSLCHITNVLHDGANFENPKVLFQCIETAFDFSGAQKSYLIQDSKESFTEEDEIETFGILYGVSKNKRTPRRGRHYCKCPGCPWNVAFTFNKKTKQFVILNNEYNEATKYKTHFSLDHNHEVAAPSIDNYIVVEYEKDLTEAEFKTLKTLALAETHMPKIEQSMMSQFSNNGKRAFGKALLHRVVMKFQKERFGGDSHRMAEFMALGKSAMQEGGTFEVDVNKIHRLVGSRFQSARMVAYTKQYGSYFVEVDGTYGTNMYGLTLMPWTIIDCLGISHISGISTGLSENTADVLGAASLFGVTSNPLKKINVSGNGIICNLNIKKYFELSHHSSPLMCIS